MKLSTSGPLVRSIGYSVVVSDEVSNRWVGLQSSNLCLRCEVIFDGPECPICRNRDYMPIRKWVQPLDAESTVAKTSEPAAGPREILTFTVYFGLGLLVGAALFKTE